VSFVPVGGVYRTGAERESIGDGVEAAVTEGVAAQNPPAREEKPADDPEALDRFHGVTGAGRLVAAAARKGR
jgi:hypothetical protein